MYIDRYKVKVYHFCVFECTVSCQSSDKIKHFTWLIVVWIHISKLPWRILSHLYFDTGNYMIHNNTYLASHMVVSHDALSLDEIFWVALKLIKNSKKNLYVLLSFHLLRSNLSIIFRDHFSLEIVPISLEENVLKSVNRDGLHHMYQINNIMWEKCRFL